jgi:hypothetical protein
MKWTQEVLKLVQKYHYLGSKRSLYFCFHMNLSPRTEENCCCRFENEQLHLREDKGPHAFLLYLDSHVLISENLLFTSYNGKPIFPQH